MGESHSDSSAGRRFWAGATCLALASALALAILAGCAPRDSGAKGGPAGRSSRPTRDIALPDGTSFPAANLGTGRDCIEISSPSARLYADKSSTSQASPPDGKPLFIISIDPAEMDWVFAARGDGSSGWLAAGDIDPEGYYNLPPGSDASYRAVVERDKATLAADSRLRRSGPFVTIAEGGSRRLVLYDHCSSRQLRYRLDELWPGDLALALAVAWEGAAWQLFDLRDSSLVATMASKPLSRSPGGRFFLCMGSYYVDDGELQIFDSQARRPTLACSLKYGIDESFGSATWGEGDRTLSVKSTGQGGTPKERRFALDESGAWREVPD